MEDTRRFVYENVEVKLTGRTAKRSLRSGKTDVIYEVTPASTQNGTWKKWVRLQELFEVSDQ